MLASSACVYLIGGHGILNTENTEVRDPSPGNTHHVTQIKDIANLSVVSCHLM